MLFFFVSASYAGIAATKHNLSISGTGSIRAVSEKRICVFCHTPHNAIGKVDGISVPLWNHTLSSASYQLFSSPTLLSPTSPAIQPDGNSRLCLSCHDGTIAIGSVVNTSSSQSSFAMQGTDGSGRMPVGPANYGTDLSGGHPISVELNNALINDKAAQCDNNLVSFKICSPPAGSPVLLQKTNNRYGGDVSGVGVQCGTCHDAHEDRDPGRTVFLRIGEKYNSEQLCNACHISDCSAFCP